jgi:hypothetical protein
MDTPIARAERREEELRGQLKEARVAMVQAHENWELAEREKMSQARSYWLEFQDASDHWNEVAAQHRRARRYYERLTGQG